MVTGCHWLHVYHVSSKIWWKQRFDHPLLRGSCRFLPKLLLGYHRLQVEHLWSWPALHPLYKWVDDIYHQLKSCPFSNFRNFDGIPWLKRISLLIGGYLKHLWWGIQQVWDLVSSAMLFFMNYAIISQFYFITFIYIYTLISLCVCVLIIVDQKYISHSIPLPPSPNCRLLNFSCRSASCFCRQSCVAPGFTRAERCWSWREVRTCRTEQETLQKERFHLGQFGLHPTDCCTYGDFPMEKWRCHPIEKKIRIWLIDFFGFDQSKWKNSPFTMQRLRFAFHHCRDLSSFLKSRVFQWKRSLWPIQMRGGVHPNRMRVGRQSPTDIGEATMTGGWSLKNSLKRGQS
jgi:hypothetical protein